jgi:hypothetical protein
MSYISLRIVEKDLTSDSINTSMIIIYDGQTEKFYLYGTRTNDGYIQYSYSYDYSEMDSMMYLIEIIMKNKKSIFNLILNNITISEEEFELVDYSYLYGKMNQTNEITSFKNISYKKMKLQEKIMNIFGI